jgi:hypothetical protein
VPYGVRTSTSRWRCSDHTTVSNRSPCTGLWNPMGAVAAYFSIHRFSRIILLALHLHPARVWMLNAAFPYSSQAGRMRCGGGACRHLARHPLGSCESDGAKEEGSSAVPPPPFIGIPIVILLDTRLGPVSHPGPEGKGEGGGGSCVPRLLVLLISTNHRPVRSPQLLNFSMTGQAYKYVVSHSSTMESRDFFCRRICSVEAV